jgi:hypothetical protein
MASLRRRSEKAQAWAEFVRRAIDARAVWAVSNERGFLGAEGADGSAAQPFWSTRGGANRMVRTVDPTGSTRVVEIPLAEFVSSSLLALSQAQVLIGVDWANDKKGWVFDAVTMRDELRRLLHLRVN